MRFITLTQVAFSYNSMVASDGDGSDRNAEEDPSSDADFNSTQRYVSNFMETILSEATPASTSHDIAPKKQK